MGREEIASDFVPAKFVSKKGREKSSRPFSFHFFLD